MRCSGSTCRRLGFLRRLPSPYRSAKRTSNRPSGPFLSRARRLRFAESWGRAWRRLTPPMGLPDSKEYPRGLLGNYDLRRLRTLAIVFSSHSAVFYFVTRLGGARRNSRCSASRSRDRNRRTSQSTRAIPGSLSGTAGDTFLWDVPIVNDGASVARHVDIEFVTNDGEVVITERRERPMPPGETEVVRLSIPRDQYRGPYDILVGWDDGRGRNREKSGVRARARVDRRRSRWRARRREERRRSSRVHLSMVPRSAVVNDPRYPLTREPRARPRSRSSRLAMCTMGT